MTTPFPNLSEVNRSLVLTDERGRKMSFPTRKDYVNKLSRDRVITGESDFINRPDLNQAVYLDWLRREQVGCVFAQIFGRKRYRGALDIEVLPGREDLDVLSTQIDAVAQRSILIPS